MAYKKRVPREEHKERQETRSLQVKTGDNIREIKEPVKRTCNLCQQAVLLSDTTLGELVSPTIFHYIQKKHPQFSEESRVCTNCLHINRAEYIRETVIQHKKEIDKVDHHVAKTIMENALLSIDPGEQRSQLTLGDRAADVIAEFGGSWMFLSVFFLFIAAWIGINTYMLIEKPFDPSPFILLNLILSCLAAIQAPIIMMSQNRLEARDRLRAKYDYQVNLKAELEIQHLNEKMDLLLKKMWHRLIEIQQMQVETMEEMRKKR
ncbi:DUF1003 domain-containing protein [Candidatus Woesearchaeota archaeon]|nr:DUF1003 domain-containing protein [Candidatus Woesearchaeota archaeon]